MNVFEWLEATTPNDPRITGAERRRRRELRKRVLQHAKTTINTLRVAKCRGAIGQELIDRLIDATKNEQEKILC